MNRLFVILGIASVLVVIWAATHDPSKAVASRATRTHNPAQNGRDLEDRRLERERKLAAIRGSRTYLAAALEPDSILRRWDDRMGAVRVYLPRHVGIYGFSDDFVAATRRAFQRWQRVRDIALRFAFVSDSSAAQVTIVWRERLSGNRTGEARIEWDQDGWIRRGTLTLATLSNELTPLTADAVEAVALHEIGHLLGLGHSDNSADLMHPVPGIHDLTPRDERSATLLYSLLPGSLGGRTNP